MRSVAKFGGSSLADIARVARAVSIILSPLTLMNRQHVVVSAPGKRTKDDNKVTDLLSSAHMRAAAGDRCQFDNMFAQISKRFPNVNIGSTAEQVYDRAQNSNSLQQSLEFCLSRGEWLNAALFASTHDGFEVVDPASFILFNPDTRQLDMKATLEACRLAVGGNIPAGNAFVIPGFYGASIGATSDIVTFSRGGSDVTASLVAAALDEHDVLTGVRSADELSNIVHENFTDVDGVYQADPRVCTTARICHQVSYDQCRAMSLAGASVLHPEAVFPLQARNVPLWVRNTSTFHPDQHEEEFTIVSERAAAVEDRSDRMSDEYDVDAAVLAICTSENTVSVVCKEELDEEMLLALVQRLEQVLGNSGVGYSSWCRHGAMSVAFDVENGQEEKATRAVFESVFER